MKIFISADIEGTTGIAHWNECEKGKADYSDFQKQMTAEVAAVCEGAIEAGVDEILIKDAHDTGRNIIVSELPKLVRIIREWSGHPYCMMQGLDDGFDAVIFTGYHSRAGADTNPLAHTLTGSSAYIKINDKYASEFLINAYTASMAGVPAVMITGDKGICDDAKELNSNISTVPVSEGSGFSSISIHPDLAVANIRSAAAAALGSDLSLCKIDLPDSFELEILYKDNRKAYAMSFYPGARLDGTHTIRFNCREYMDVLKLLMFLK